MKKILVLLGSVKPQQQSVSSRIVNSFLNTYKKYNEADSVEVIECQKLENISFTSTIMSGQVTDEDTKIITNRKDLLTKFKEADKIVLGSPMWNLGLPGKVKECIDTFCVAGETFQYLAEPNERGEIMEALIPGKKLLFVQAMGGFNVGVNDIGYAQIRALFGFIGIDDITYVPVQACDIPGMSEEEKCNNEVQLLAKTF